MAEESPAPKDVAPAAALKAAEPTPVVRPRKSRSTAAAPKGASASPKPARSEAPAPKPKGPIAKRSSAPPKEPAGPPATVVDASGLILGRAASLIAHRLLRGESIVVVHAERSVVVGARPMVLAFYRANRARGSKRTGPHYPRYPDRIFRRTVRGMLPHRKTRGREAFDRLKVYIGCPAGFQASTPEWASAAKARPALRPPLALSEISTLLGARL